MAGAAAVLMAALLCCACGYRPRFDTQGELALSQRDGHPVLISGNAHVHFDWRGRMTGVSRRAKQRLCNIRAQQIDLRSVPDELADLLKPDFDWPMVINCVWQRSMPEGWRSVTAVTVGTLDADEELLPGMRFDAFVLDSDSGDLLAELNLNGMFASLYGRQSEMLGRAYVQAATLGPDGGMGLTVLFMSESVFNNETGVWVDNKWVPLASPGGLIPPADIVVGPGNRSAVYFGTPGLDELRFFDSDGALLTSVQVYPQSLQVLADDWRKRTAVIAAVVAGIALSAVALLGLIWWFGPLNRARRGA